MIYRRHQRNCPYRGKGRRYWKCSCPIHFDARVQGKRIQEAMETTDWELAQQLSLSRVKGESAIVNPAPPAPRQSEEMSLDRPWENFLARAQARNLKQSTLAKYELLSRKMNAFAERKGLRLLKDFNLDVLEGWQTEWKESPVTRIKQLERLKAFFRAAHIRRWIDEDPTVAMRGPKLNLKPTLPFPKEEMRAILAASEIYVDKTGKTGQANSVRLRAFILLLRYSGMRIGDAVSLRPERLDRNKLFLYTHKTGQPVSLILPSFVAEALRHVPRLSERYFFWTGRSTLHTAIGIWQRTLRNLFERERVLNGHAHRFRDTFATELLLSGAPIEQVSVLLGHSSIRITEMHYRPWVRDRQRQLEVSLERAWGQDPIVLLETDKSLEIHRKNETIH
jgi:integrase/recombinase XerD